MTPPEVEEAIRQLVDQANAAKPGNQCEYEEISSWLTNHLAGRREEGRRFPAEADKHQI
jgi:hypothetical protein